MDRSRFNIKYYLNDNLNIFLLDDIKYEPQFFYIDFSLPENRNLKLEDFFWLNLTNLYFNMINIYLKKQKMYVYITKIHIHKLLLLNIVSL